MAAAAHAKAGSGARRLSTDTIVAPSTAPGPAPRGVVRLSGPAAFDVLARAFVPDDPAAPRRGFRRGALVLDRLGTACPAHVWGFTAPASYTGEDVAECHLAGAPKVLEMAVRRLVLCGARPAVAGEFTRRALQNGKLDLTRAEAVCALIRARDEGEHRKARALLEGGLARAVATLVDRVVGLLVPIEVSLDFSDQEIALDPDAGAADAIRALAGDVGACEGPGGVAARRLLPRVVLRGPANAGKSSLFNALLGRDAALATPVRGTTRDVLSAEWSHGGVRAILADTAGDDVLETDVDRLARDARERALLEADVVVEVRDLRSGGWPPRSSGVLRVGTMRDLAPPHVAPAAEVVLVSSVTGEGLDDLRERLAACLMEGSARRSAPFLVTARQASHLERARCALDRAASVFGVEPPEFAASDLRHALRELRGVVGAEEGDPVLDRIFREFCVGK